VSRKCYSRFYGGVIAATAEESSRDRFHGFADRDGFYADDESGLA